MDEKTIREFIDRARILQAKLDLLVLPEVRRAVAKVRHETRDTRDADAIDQHNAEIANARTAWDDVVVVCIPAEWPSPFKDNMLSVCSQCECTIAFRPYLTPAPVKICVTCYPSFSEANKDEIGKIE
jgi:hypothetical protein